MTVTLGIVTFDPVAFTTQYPSFVNVTSVALQNNFDLACLQLNNSYCSVVQDEPTRAQLLYLLTAHITALLNGVNGQQPTGLVGRISSATQGSVTANVDYLSNPTEAEAYLTQTQWGATFWRSTVVYRTARYIAPSCYDQPSWEAWPE
jgi:Protein of unknown function (DUF4054)